MSAFATCPYCGMLHSYMCPRVKAYEYYPDGTLKRVEFHGPQKPEAIVGDQPLEIPCWTTTHDH